MKKLGWALAAAAVLLFVGLGNARADTPTPQPADESAADESVADVTEPLALLLMGTGLAGLIGAARRRYRADGFEHED